MSCLQLAWEMLEVARSIYSKMGDEKVVSFACASISVAFALHVVALAGPSQMKSLWQACVMQA